MRNLESADERLLELAHSIDFARRYYSIVNASRNDEPASELPETEILSALESTGRSFRFNRREKFFAFREPDVPGELGINLSFSYGQVEFILVARGPNGHFGPPFTLLARTVAQRHAPELVPSPRAPRPCYSDQARLRSVLAEGLRLYEDLATAIRTNGLLSCVNG